MVPFSSSQLRKLWVMALDKEYNEIATNNEKRGYNDSRWSRARSDGGSLRRLFPLIENE